MQILKQIHASSGGFSLIETFVAIAILMLALVGPLTLAQQSLSNATVSADQITSYYLAQDAMEYMRNIRDSNIKSGNGWLDSLGACLPGPCRIDTSADLTVAAAVTACNPSNDTCTLRYDDNSASATFNRYGYDAGFPVLSQFKRYIETESRSGGDEIIVTVTIEWETGSFDGEFEARQSLFNIIP